MLEWMIAMLVIGLMLIVRDMAKTFLERRTIKKEELFFIGEEHPQKVKVQQYAASFQKLADTFYGMPYRRDYFSNGQIEGILKACQEQVCSICYQRGICLEEHSSDWYLIGTELIRAMESGNEEQIGELRSRWISVCGKAIQYMDVINDRFQKEKQDLIWGNRMIESRLAVAQQLGEISKIMEHIAEDLYDLEYADHNFFEQVQKMLKKRQIIVKQIFVKKRADGKKQVILHMRARSGQCVSVSEVAQILTEICVCHMTASPGSRCIVNGEYHMVHFMEDASYQILYGVSKLPREEEKVSGDNYICRQEENGRFVMCLSDGMGSGMAACNESEIVVELLEQFLESGFSQETAAKMINSALIMKEQNGMFSTVDICAVDLYTGICNFLKAGAAASFIKRDHWVEVITSESLAVGLVQQLDFDTTSRKLYHGDYLIMMTDGVLDALPPEHGEEIIKEIILGVQEETPKEISRGILERVLGYCDYHAKDDMTVLVAGIWRK